MHNLNSVRRRTATEPPVKPPPEPEKKTPPIGPPKRDPKPEPIYDPPMPPSPGTDPKNEPVPIGDPPDKSDQPIRMSRTSAGLTNGWPTDESWYRARGVLIKNSHHRIRDLLELRERSFL